MSVEIGNIINYANPGRSVIKERPDNSHLDLIKQAGSLAFADDRIKTGIPTWDATDERRRMRIFSKK